MRSLRAIAVTLLDLAREIERRTTKPPVDVAILERLAEDDYSGRTLALLLRRQREVVLRTCLLLEAAGKIRRVGQRWTLEV